MAKGYFLTNEIKMLIAKIHNEHPDWGPTKTREELVRVLRKTGLYKNFDKNWPSVSAVGSVLRPIKKKESELGPDPCDKPWTITSIAKYPIPPEALPAILRVWFFAQDRTTFTIREAQWAARLYAAIEDTENLYGLSRTLAVSERLFHQFQQGKSTRIEDYMETQMHNMWAFSIMTGHIITKEEEKRLYGWPEEVWRHYEELWSTVRDEADIPEGRRPIRLGIRFEEFEETEPSQKEVKNERKHRRSKNEGRHNKTR